MQHDNKSKKIISRIVGAAALLFSSALSEVQADERKDLSTANTSISSSANNPEESASDLNNTTATSNTQNQVAKNPNIFTDTTSIAQNSNTIPDDKIPVDQRVAKYDSIVLNNVNVLQEIDLKSFDDVPGFGAIKADVIKNEPNQVLREKLKTLVDNFNDQNALNYIAEYSLNNFYLNTKTMQSLHSAALNKSIPNPKEVAVALITLTALDRNDPNAQGAFKTLLKNDPAQAATYLNLLPSGTDAFIDAKKNLRNFIAANKTDINNAKNVLSIRNSIQKTGYYDLFNTLLNDDSMSGNGYASLRTILNNYINLANSSSVTNADIQSIADLYKKSAVLQVRLGTSLVPSSFNDSQKAQIIILSLLAKGGDDAKATFNNYFKNHEKDIDSLLNQFAKNGGFVPNNAFYEAMLANQPDLLKSILTKNKLTVNDYRLADINISGYYLINESTDDSAIFLSLKNDVETFNKAHNIATDNTGIQASQSVVDKLHAMLKDSDYEQADIFKSIALVSAIQTQDKTIQANVVSLLQSDPLKAAVYYSVLNDSGFIADNEQLNQFFNTDNVALTTKIKTVLTDSQLSSLTNTARTSYLKNQSETTANAYINRLLADPKSGLTDYDKQQVTKLLNAKVTTATNVANSLLFFADIQNNNGAGFAQNLLNTDPVTAAVYISILQKDLDLVKTNKPLSDFLNKQTSSIINSLTLLNSAISAKKTGVDNLAYAANLTSSNPTFVQDVNNYLQSYHAPTARAFTDTTTIKNDFFKIMNLSNTGDVSKIITNQPDLALFLTTLKLLAVQQPADENGLSIIGSFLKDHSDVAKAQLILANKYHILPNDIKSYLLDNFTGFYKEALPDDKDYRLANANDYRAMPIASNDLSFLNLKDGKLDDVIVKAFGTSLAKNVQDYVNLVYNNASLQERRQLATVINQSLLSTFPDKIKQSLLTDNTVSPELLATTLIMWKFANRPESSIKLLADKFKTDNPGMIAVMAKVLDDNLGLSLTSYFKSTKTIDLGDDLDYKVNFNASGAAPLFAYYAAHSQDPAFAAAAQAFMNDPEPKNAQPILNWLADRFVLKADERANLLNPNYKVSDKPTLAIMYLMAYMADKDERPEAADVLSQTLDASDKNKITQKSMINILTSMDRHDLITKNNSIWQLLADEHPALFADFKAELNKPTGAAAFFKKLGDGIKGMFTSAWSYFKNTIWKTVEGVATLGQYGDPLAVAKNNISLIKNLANDVAKLNDPKEWKKLGVTALSQMGITGVFLSNLAENDGHMNWDDVSVNLTLGAIQMAANFIPGVGEVMMSQMVASIEQEKDPLADALSLVVNVGAGHLIEQKGLKIGDNPKEIAYPNKAEMATDLANPHEALATHQETLDNMKSDAEKALDAKIIETYNAKQDHVEKSQDAQKGTLDDENNQAKIAELDAQLNDLLQQKTAEITKGSTADVNARLQIEAKITVLQDHISQLKAEQASVANNDTKAVIAIDDKTAMTNTAVTDTNNHEISANKTAANDKSFTPDAFDSQNNFIANTADEAPHDDVSIKTDEQTTSVDENPAVSGEITPTQDIAPHADISTPKNIDSSANSSIRAIDDKQQQITEAQAQLRELVKQTTVASPDNNLKIQQAQQSVAKLINERDSLIQQASIQQKATFDRQIATNQLTPSAMMAKAEGLVKATTGNKTNSLLDLKNELLKITASSDFSIQERVEARAMADIMIERRLGVLAGGGVDVLPRASEVNVNEQLPGESSDELDEIGRNKPTGSVTDSRSSSPEALSDKNSDSGKGSSDGDNSSQNNFMSGSETSSRPTTPEPDESASEIVGLDEAVDQLQSKAEPKTPGVSNLKGSRENNTLGSVKSGDLNLDSQALLEKYDSLTEDKNLTDPIFNEANKNTSSNTKRAKSTVDDKAYVGKTEKTGKKVGFAEATTERTFSIESEPEVYLKDSPASLMDEETAVKDPSQAAAQTAMKRHLSDLHEMANLSDRDYREYIYLKEEYVRLNELDERIQSINEKTNALNAELGSKSTYGTLRRWGAKLFDSKAYAQLAERNRLVDEMNNFLQEKATIIDNFRGSDFSSSINFEKLNGADAESYRNRAITDAKALSEQSGIGKDIKNARLVASGEKRIPIVEVDYLEKDIDNLAISFEEKSQRYNDLKTRVKEESDSTRFKLDDVTKQLLAELNKPEITDTELNAHMTDLRNQSKNSNLPTDDREVFKKQFDTLNTLIQERGEYQRKLDAINKAQEKLTAIDKKLAPQEKIAAIDTFNKLLNAQKETHDLMQEKLEEFKGNPSQDLKEQIKLYEDQLAMLNKKTIELTAKKQEAFNQLADLSLESGSASQIEKVQAAKESIRNLDPDMMDDQFDRELDAAKQAKLESLKAERAKYANNPKALNVVVLDNQIELLEQNIEASKNSHAPVETAVTQQNKVPDFTVMQEKLQFSWRKDLEELNKLKAERKKLSGKKGKALDEKIAALQKKANTTRDLLNNSTYASRIFVEHYQALEVPNEKYKGSLEQLDITQPSENTVRQVAALNEQFKNTTLTPEESEALRTQMADKALAIDKYLSQQVVEKQQQLTNLAAEKESLSWYQVRIKARLNKEIAALQQSIAAQTKTLLDFNEQFSTPDEAALDRQKKEDQLRAGKVKEAQDVKVAQADYQRKKVSGELGIVKSDVLMRALDIVKADPNVTAETKAKIDADKIRVENGYLPKDVLLNEATIAQATKELKVEQRAREINQSKYKGNNEERALRDATAEFDKAAKKAATKKTRATEVRFSEEEPTRSTYARPATEASAEATIAIDLQSYKDLLAELSGKVSNPKAFKQALAELNKQAKFITENGELIPEQKNDLNDYLLSQNRNITEQFNKSLNPDVLELSTLEGHKGKPNKASAKKIADLKATISAKTKLAQEFQASIDSFKKKVTNTKAAPKSEVIVEASAPALSTGEAGLRADLQANSGTEETNARSSEKDQDVTRVTPLSKEKLEALIARKQEEINKLFQEHNNNLYKNNTKRIIKAGHDLNVLNEKWEQLKEQELKEQELKEQELKKQFLTRPRSNSESRLAETKDTWSEELFAHYAALNDEVAKILKPLPKQFTDKDKIFEPERLAKKTDNMDVPLMEPKSFMSRAATKRSAIEFINGFYEHEHDKLLGSNITDQDVSQRLRQLGKRADISETNLNLINYYAKQLGGLGKGGAPTVSEVKRTFGTPRQDKDSIKPLPKSIFASQDTALTSSFSSPDGKENRSPTTKTEETPPSVNNGIENRMLSKKNTSRSLFEPDMTPDASSSRGEIDRAQDQFPLNDVDNRDVNSFSPKGRPNPFDQKELPPQLDGSIHNLNEAIEKQKNSSAINLTPVTPENYAERLQTYKELAKTARFNSKQIAQITTVFDMLDVQSQISNALQAASDLYNYKPSKSLRTEIAGYEKQLRALNTKAGELSRAEISTSPLDRMHQELKELSSQRDALAKTGSSSLDTQLKIRELDARIDDLKEIITGNLSVSEKPNKVEGTIQPIDTYIQPEQVAQTTVQSLRLSREIEKLTLQKHKLNKEKAALEKPMSQFDANINGLKRQLVIQTDFLVAKQKSKQPTTDIDDLILTLKAELLKAGTAKKEYKQKNDIRISNLDKAIVKLDNQIKLKTNQIKTLSTNGLDQLIYPKQFQPNADDKQTSALEKKVNVLKMNDKKLKVLISHTSDVRNLPWNELMDQFIDLERLKSSPQSWQKLDQARQTEITAMQTELEDKLLYVNVDKDNVGQVRGGVERVNRAMLDLLAQAKLGKFDDKAWDALTEKNKDIQKYAQDETSHKIAERQAELLNSAINKAIDYNYGFHHPTK